MRNLFVSLFAGLMVATGSVPAQQAWTPNFELRTTTKKLNVGQTFRVDFYASVVGGDTLGYQSEVHFDPKSVKPLTITQGPYLRFKTFFGSPGAFPTLIRIGALNFPNPTPLPKGTGSGVLATATFQALKPGPINLDMRVSLFTVNGPRGAISYKGTTKDVTVQIRAAGDILSVSGRPNPNDSIELELFSPPDAGRNVITAGSFSNTGLPLPGGVTVPIGSDILLDLAIANTYPYTNSVTKLDSSGRAITKFTVPNDSRLIGIKIYFGSVIYSLGPVRFHKASNGTHVVYISP